MSTITNQKQGGILTQYERVNFSTAKQKFSFSRGPRFPSVAKKVSDKVQYDLKSCFENTVLFTKRAPSFGIGERFHRIVKTKDQPSPGSYQISSEFDSEAPTAVTRKIAYTFGASWKDYEKVYSPNQKTSLDIDTPGPGMYAYYDPIGKNAQQYSMRARVQAPNDIDILRINSKQDVPGPGSYRPNTGLNNIGVYFISNITNSGATRISPRSPRFGVDPNAQIMKNPGPGQYEAKDYADLKNDRVYFLSQFKSPGTRRFGTSQRLRNDGLKNFIPGPGEYRPPSEFGYLQFIPINYQLNFSDCIIDTFSSPRTSQSPRKFVGIQFPLGVGKGVSGGERLKSRQNMSMTATSSPKNRRIIINNNNTITNEQTKQPFNYSRRDSHLSQPNEGKRRSPK